MFRREALLAIGGFNPCWYHAEVNPVVAATSPSARAVCSVNSSRRPCLYWSPEKGAWLETLTATLSAKSQSIASDRPIGPQSAFAVAGRRNLHEVTHQRSDA